MADQVKQEKKAATEIAYCPHLDVYHYRRADGEEWIFDTVQLEAAVEGYLKAGDARQAEFMAMLTGFARKFPHKVVWFDEEGKLNLRELLEIAPTGEEAIEAEVVEPAAGK